jgi:hypothetical protein
MFKNTQTHPPTYPHKNHKKKFFRFFPILYVSLKFEPFSYLGGYDICIQVDPIKKENNNKKKKVLDLNDTIWNIIKPKFWSYAAQLSMNWAC